MTLTNISMYDIINEDSKIRKFAHERRGRGKTNYKGRTEPSLKSNLTTEQSLLISGQNKTQREQEREGSRRGDSRYAPEASVGVVAGSPGVAALSRTLIYGTLIHILITRLTLKRVG